MVRWQRDWVLDERILWLQFFYINYFWCLHILFLFYKINDDAAFASE